MITAIESWVKEKKANCKRSCTNAKDKRKYKRIIKDNFPGRVEQETPGRRVRVKFSVDVWNGKFEKRSDGNPGSPADKVEFRISPREPRFPRERRTRLNGSSRDDPGIEGTIDPRTRIGESARPK